MRKKFSGVIMLLGLYIGAYILYIAKTDIQVLVALLPIAGNYVLGRAIENFSDK